MQVIREILLWVALALTHHHHLAHGFQYGPSLEYLTSESDFSGSPKRVIKLADFGPTYSVLVPLAINKSTAEPHVVRPVGEFAVEAPENMRVMAVIQSLHLRKKSFTSAFPPVCRDYIVFGDDSINKVCGDVVRSDRKGAPNGMMGERTYFSPGNVLNVTVYTDVSTFVETWMNIPNTVEIVFTAYQTCPFYDPDEYLFNCLDNIIPYGPSCIPSNLTCDGVVNCGFLSDGTFGRDEMDCPNNDNETVVIVPTVSTSVSRPASPPPTSSSNPVESRTGFPNWWENWRKMQLEESKNHLNLLNLNGHFATSDKADGMNKSPEGDRFDIRRTSYFEPEYKSNVNYFNSFALYALCFYAGVSGIFVILKVAMRYCNDDSSASVRSTSNLMRDPSTFSVGNGSDGSPSSVRSHSELPYSLPRSHHIHIDVRDFELPPSYESLFPGNEVSQDCEDTSTTPSTEEPLPPPAPQMQPQSQQQLQQLRPQEP